MKWLAMEVCGKQRDRRAENRREGGALKAGGGGGGYCGNRVSSADLALLRLVPAARSVYLHRRVRHVESGMEVLFCVLQSIHTCFVRLPIDHLTKGLQLSSSG